ncbi:hypothetical protein M569_16874, partial [Genlisea aurea]
RRAAAAAERRKPVLHRRSKASLSVDRKSKYNKPKTVSLKNQIRSIERMLRKDLPLEVKESQNKKLEELKRQQDIHNRLVIESQLFLRDRKIKFFERRKIERRLRRLEKRQRSSTGQTHESEVAEQLEKLKEDLEYVKFFPKTERYVSLFMGGDATEIVEKRNRLRKQIKANLIAAAASGKDLEETGSEDDGFLDLSDDDFFLNGSSSDEANADDEWSARDQASSASGIAASGMSSDERNQRRISALMPPPGPSRSKRYESKSAASSSSKRSEMFTSSNRTTTTTSSSTGLYSIPERRNTGNNGSLSSNSDARKPRRKRRPKKKKMQ